MNQKSHWKSHSRVNSYFNVLGSNRNPPGHRAVFFFRLVVTSFATSLSNKCKEMGISGRVNSYLWLYLFWIANPLGILVRRLYNSFRTSKCITVFSPVGLDWDSISECVEWMVPFVNVARKVSVKLKHFKKVAVEDCHNIQTHTNYLDMLVGGLQSCALYSPSSEVLKALQADGVSMPHLVVLAFWR